MPITISPTAFTAIVEHSRQQFPLEACGLIAGKVTDDGKTIEKAYPLPNLAQSRYRFDIDPKDQLKAIVAMRQEGLAPLGNYHSHPETPSRPSSEDLKLFIDPKASYLIVSLAQRLPLVKAFSINSSETSGFIEEELIVTKI
ncbi:MAG: M67 family metallopeptidase [Deltaproteobacteria bacterium]|jgi:proteasome lid subunit RPN8/RPN11|nr:M67 family metallopeptidase [Deltaproteobacteria bacterium]